ncbi:MAG TPA: uracil-DNA glycosylase family protein [Chitinophagaceae bacterium]|nr:uracil-DNA glycosylase family protein [Chitinophagaceae bacterium]
MQFSRHILSFFRQLEFSVKLPKGIEVMHPFKDAETMKICTRFYKKYYADNNRRWMIVGINPGRFGGGVTGIPFTDPIRLKQVCGIDNPWPLKQELSSVFMYDMINAFGGPEAFYGQFYITSISPLGFTRDNKNLNYYDDKTLQDSIKPFVLDCFEKQFAFGTHRTTAFCLGDGKNFQYLSRLNKEVKLFDNIIPLSHPRFIMQYRLKKKQEYIDYYIKQFHEQGISD